jgi:hypothetical protein
MLHLFFSHNDKVFAQQEEKDIQTTTKQRDLVVLSVLSEAKSKM